MNDILEEDICDIVERCRKFQDSFSGKTFLITGATGLVGSLMVRALLRMDDECNTGIKIIITTRNKERARSLFNDGRVEILEDSEDVRGGVNYIVHAAAPTQSKIYVEEPVETMDAMIMGTKRVLEIARDEKVEKFLYISSMEAYGTVLEKKKVSEDDLGFIALNSPRSSYPEGKRAAELYTYSYYSEYGVNAVTARLVMCFGAGIRKEDNRVHKSFCEEALAGRDIVVKSKGETVVNFVYAVDAVVALFELLINGMNGETYNIVGHSGGATIMDMARIVAKIGGANVKQEVSSGVTRFAPENKMVLDGSKMEKLGWRPEYDLEGALARLYEFLEEEKKKE